MRRYYIDNLRNITILFLFPVHTFMIWNDFGMKFYVWGGENRILSSLIVLVNPWFMPILFVIAGMSARYSMEKRSTKEFIRQRIQKLFVPFLGGMVLFVPFQTLYARKFFFAYEGGILENLIYFFTHITDLNGYDGAFTPGHLWFILFLFLISLLSLPVIKYLPYDKVKGKIEGMSAGVIAGMFIPVWLMYYLGNFGGFSIGKCFALYMLGYYLLSNEKMMDKLEQSGKWMACLYFPAAAALVIAYYKYAYYGDLAVNFIGWMGILTLLAFGKKYLDHKTVFTEYFNRKSFAIYVLHQSILVAIGYYILTVCDNFFVQVTGICIFSFVLTIISCHLVKKIPYLRKIIYS